MLNSSKYNCGNIIPSNCVPYTGPALTILEGTDVELSCDANLDEVIGYLDTALKALMDSNDFTSLVPDCIDFDPATVTAVELHALELDKLCELEGLITDLTTALDDFDISTELITIDLDCMAADAAPCEVPDSQYTLQSILQLFVTWICDHETRISNLE